MEDDDSDRDYSCDICNEIIENTTELGGRLEYLIVVYKSLQT